MPHADVNGVRLPYEQTGDNLVPDAAEAAQLLPHGDLAVLPGTTHMGMTRSTLVAPVVEAFLEASCGG